MGRSAPLGTGGIERLAEEERLAEDAVTGRSITEAVVWRSGEGGSSLPPGRAEGAREGGTGSGREGEVRIWMETKEKPVF